MASAGGHWVKTAGTGIEPIGKMVFVSKGQSMYGAIGAKVGKMQAENGGLIDGYPESIQKWEQGLAWPQWSAFNDALVKTYDANNGAANYNKAQEAAQAAKGKEAVNALNAYAAEIQAKKGLTTLGDYIKEPVPAKSAPTYPKKMTPTQLTKAAESLGKEYGHKGGASKENNAAYQELVGKTKSEKTLLKIADAYMFGIKLGQAEGVAAKVFADGKGYKAPAQVPALMKLLHGLDFAQSTKVMKAYQTHWTKLHMKKADDALLAEFPNFYGNNQKMLGGK